MIDFDNNSKKWCDVMWAPFGYSSSIRNTFDEFFMNWTKLMGHFASYHIYLEGTIDYEKSSEGRLAELDWAIIDD